MKKTALAFLIIIGGLIGEPISADEPAEAFLEALRERGYYDVAIDYLNGLDNSDLISADFRQSLPFEKAQTLISSTDNMGDMNLVAVRLDQAQALLNEYANKDQSVETLAQTFLHQGNLYYRRSKVFLFQGRSDRLTANEKDDVSTKAREMLEGALNSYQQARQTLRSLIDPNSPDAIRIDVEDPSTTAKLNRFKGIYTQVRIRLPMVIEQLADTYPVDSAERTQGLESAITEYNDVYADYQRRYLAGLEAVLYSARCYQKLGKHNEVQFSLENIFDLSDNSTFKPLKRRAFILAVDSWDQIQPYPHAEVIGRLQPVVSLLNRSEIREPDWLRIQMELAKALHVQANVIKDQGGPRSNSEAKELDREAAKIMRAVSRIPSEYRERAKQLLAEWNISVSKSAETSEQPPESFVDAKQKGQDLIVEIESLLGDANQLKSQLAGAASEDQKPAIQTELQDTETRIAELSQAALNMFELALRLADDTTPRTDINNIRYLQSYCYFAMRQYFESALIGEFLLAKYPTIEGTRQAMTLMIRSYSQLHTMAGEGDKAFERNRLTEACRAIVERWPGSNEAGSAANTLTRLAIIDGNFATAQEYFGQVSQNATYRPSLASKLGQRMWFDYRAKSAGGKSEELETQLNHTRDYLQTAVENANPENLQYETVLSALLLVDANLEAGDAEKALHQLENAEIAPLDLVKQKHPVLDKAPSRAGFIRETYKIAIKTYLAAMRTADDQQLWIEKASGIIAAMRNDMEASNDPKDRQRVTTIYRLIAKELKQQFEALETVDEKKRFAGSLASFLGSIEQDSSDSKTVLWAGSTLLSVADSLSQLSLDANAKPLFQQAVSALNRAESLGFEGDPQEAAMTMELKRQRALAQRGAGNYEAALDQFTEILKQNSKSLQIQIDAAEALQSWAKVSKRARLYGEAMMGSRKFTNPTTKRDSNLIWGWRKMVQATRSNPKFKDTYFKALYHLIECRLEYGVLEESDKAIKSSLKELTNAEKRHPELGGPARKQRFMELKQRIQQAQK